MIWTKTFIYARMEGKPQENKRGEGLLYVLEDDRCKLVELASV